MRYTIEGFSQQRAVELGLSAEDLVILRWFVDFWPSDKMTKMVHEGKTYAIVSYSGFIAQMPIISCNKRTIARKFKRLVDANVLENATIKNGGSFSVYKFGEEYDSLVYKSSAVAQDSAEGLHKNEQPGMYKNEQTKTNQYNSTSQSNTNIPPNPQGEEPNGSEREDAEPTLEEEKRNPDHEYCKTVMDLYNAICKNLLSAKKVTVKRKRAVKKAKKDIEEFGGWEKYFSCVESRPFLNGKNKDGWKADFDWLLKPDKMLNIMEGKYNTQANSNYSYRKEPESMQEKYEALAREEERLKASGEYVESEIPF